MSGRKRSRGAMAVTRAEKEQELQDLERGVQRRPTRRSLSTTRGLNVPQVTELRRQLRGAKASYKVVKNTLARRAQQGHQAGVARSAVRGDDGDCLYGR